MDNRVNMHCVLKVDTNSGGWEKSLTKMLKKIKGAQYSLEAGEGTLHVYGKVDPTKVLKKLKKAGKAVEICSITTGDEFMFGYSQMNRAYPNNGYGNGYYPPYSYGQQHQQAPMNHHYSYGAPGYPGFY